MKKIAVVVLVVIIVAVGAYFLLKKKPPPPAPQAVPVLAGKAVQKSLPVLVDAIGTVDAYKSVTVYSRVVGQLQKIHFKEGQDVRKGDMLFTIDPAPFREKLRQAEARLAQDEAQFKYAQAEAERYKYLVERGAVSKSDHENKQTIASTQEALVRADKSAVDEAKVNLEYCSITSPMDARTGSHSVYEGVMVKDNDTKLVTLNQISPAYVKFSVSEKQLPEIRKFMGAGTLKVTASPPGIKDKAAEGTLSFMDNAVDSATGMIVLKATFLNGDRFLWPGQFVTVSLRLTTESNVTVVPSRAVLQGQKGAYVFVVGPKGTAELRTVEAGRTVGEETVVTKGVKPGETLVTDGQLKLRDGFPVQIKESLTSEPGKPRVGAGGAPNDKTQASTGKTR
jgi:multidrug efflux system membrane fusion protein